MRYKRLQHLLEKSNIYSKFLLTKMEQQQLEVSVFSVVGILKMNCHLLFCFSSAEKLRKVLPWNEVVLYVILRVCPINLYTNQSGKSMNFNHSIKVVVMSLQFFCWPER